MKHVCPVCGEHHFDRVDDLKQCPVCGWVNIMYDEENPDKFNFEIGMSLNDYKEMWEEEKNSK